MAFSSKVVTTELMEDGLRFVYLFNVGQVSSETVKTNLGKAVGRRGTILTAVRDERGRFFKVGVSLDDRDTWNALMTLRKNIRVDGKYLVIVAPDNIFGPVTLLYDSGLLPNLASLQSSALYNENATYFPYVENGRGVSPWIATIRTSDFREALTFNDRLRRIIFDEADALLFAEESPLGDDPRQVDPISKSNVWIPVRLMGIDVRVVEIGAADILKDDSQGIVLPMHANMSCIDESLRGRLAKMLGHQYADECDKIMESGAPKVGDVVSVSWRNDSLRASRVLHLIIDSKLPIDQLSAAYSNCFRKATELGLITLAFFIPLLPGKEKECAEIAGRSILTAIGNQSINLIGTIKFLHYDHKVAKSFGQAFAATCNATATTVTRPSSYYDRTTTRSVSYDDDDSRKMDVAMALPPKPAADIAHWLLEAVEVPVPVPKRKEDRKLREYGKRSEEEKRKMKQLNLDQLKQFDITRTRKFVEYLTTIPNQDGCHICEDTFSSSSEGDQPQGSVEETEICPRCYRSFHVECLDKCKQGACPLCVSQVNDGDQLAGGKVKIRVVASGTVPGYPDASGYIEITYSIPSGFQGTNHPAPGKFCYGIHRVAYLPNTEQGLKISKMLEAAFQRGIIFCVSKSLSFLGDYDHAWNCIPHKVSLTGGRRSGGYPDETYLSRVENILNMIKPSNVVRDVEL